MSDTDLRHILDEVIEDIDSGRVILPRPRGFRLGALLAGPALAAGMMMAGCDRAQPAYGVPPTDAQVADASLDGGPDAAYMAPFDAAVDAALDDGAVPEYGVPPDAGPRDGAVNDGAVDDGAVVDYGVPFDAGADGGGVPLYGAPPPPRR